ncbi:MAG TPA: hypothetical protein VF808_15575 [Ktedonobacterales bacterium]
MGLGWDGKGHKRANGKPRRWWRGVVSLLLTLALGVAIGAIFSHGPPIALASAPGPTLSGTSYGASHSRMQSAANAATWPQQNSLWCGVATVAAIGRYQGSTSVTQQGVANYLNSDAAVSVWGVPSHASGYWGPGFRADISRDFGTDPRSLAAGMDWATAGQYHQFVAGADPLDASIRLARDLERSTQPISVFVDHAFHSVVVSAVFSTTDPMTNPGGITGFEVWDPGWSVANGGIQPNEFEDVSLNTWLTDSVYWGGPYNVNLINGYIYDPNPAVGPYRYDPSVSGHAATLWSGHYVYVRPDPVNVLSARASVDWAFNQNGQLIKGFSGELSPGYRGSTAVWEGAKVTLGSTTSFNPAFSARGSYDSAAAGSAPAAALVYAGTDSAHHLNVRTTQDGLSYSSVLALSYTTSAAPAVVVMPPAQSGSQNIVYLAWDGTDSAHSINLLYDVYNVTGHSQTLTLSFGSASSPSVAYFSGQVWLTWAGTDSNHRLNVLPLGPQGMTPGTITTLSSLPGASGGPSLLNDAQLQRLVLSWAQAGSGTMTYRISPDGVQWTAPAGAVSLSASSGGATMVASLIQLPGGEPGYPTPAAYMVWRIPGGDLLAQPFTSSLAPGLSQLVPEQTSYAPVASYIAGPDFILVWAGTNSGHNINAAQMQM